jgi:hypothetical protein
VLESWEMRWVGHVVHMGEMRSVYRFSIGKHQKLGRDRIKLKIL